MRHGALCGCDLPDTAAQPADTQAELSRRMGARPQELTRIMDLVHATKIDTVADALVALGKQLTVDAHTPSPT